MASETILIEACRLALDDDAPRLVWADMIGGERGELVVLQCDLARGGLAPAQAAARRRRERELLAKYGKDWTGLARFASRWEFRRGFVEAAAISLTAFVEHSDEIFAAAPLLVSLTAEGLTGAYHDDDGMHRGPQALALLKRLFESAGFWRLHGLDLQRAGVEEHGGGGYGRMFTGVGDEAAALLAESGALAHLRALGIASSDLGPTGAHALIASRELEHLERLWLREHALGDDAVIALLERTPRLASLELQGRHELGVIAHALGPLTELRLARVDDNGIDAVAATRAASSLETLVLDESQILDAHRLEAFPRLRTLDLRYGWRGLLSLDSTKLPAVRRLLLDSQTPESVVLAIARAFGPQLELLDVAEVSGVARIADELRVLVAGEVLEGQDFRQRDLL